MKRRHVLIGGVVLVLLAPLIFLEAYTVAARRLLSGPKLRALINVRSKDFLLDYDAAASVWPGHATFRNLRLRGSDPNVQWYATIADLEVDYSVLALLKRTIQLTDARGTGLAFSLRGKLPPQDAKSAAAALLPPIPGFSDPPLKSADDVFFVDPKAWSVDVRHLAIARFEDIWVNGIRYRGKAAVEGGFFLRPLTLARIDAAALRLGRGDLQIGKAEGMSLSGTITALSKPFAPLRAPMPEALREFSATAKLDVVSSRLEALQATLAPPGGLRIEGGVATAKIDAAIQEGIATGKLSVAVKNGVVRIPQYRLRGEANIEVPVRKWDVLKPPFDVSGAKVALANVRPSGSGADETRDWWGRLEIPSGRLGGGIVAGRFAMQCRDARPLLALLGVTLPGWTNALLKLDNFAATATVTATPSTLRVQDLDAKGGNFQILGQFAHDGKAGRGAFLIESGILIVGVEMAPPNTKVRPFFARQWYEKLQKEEPPKGKGR